jgi:hypothetical protein
MIIKKLKNTTRKNILAKQKKKKNNYYKITLVIITLKKTYHVHNIYTHIQTNTLTNCQKCTNGKQTRKRQI